jgi:hypothetical protein
MRMLERKRLAKQYQIVPGEEDVELGDGVGAQESGTVTAAVTAPTLDEEVENWDENLEDGCKSQLVGELFPLSYCFRFRLCSSI